jgi:hypothetical protein
VPEEYEASLCDEPRTPRKGMTAQTQFPSDPPERDKISPIESDLDRNPHSTQCSAELERPTTNHYTSLRYHLLPLPEVETPTCSLVSAAMRTLLRSTLAVLRWNHRRHLSLSVPFLWAFSIPTQVWSCLYSGCVCLWRYSDFANRFFLSITRC